MSMPTRRWSLARLGLEAPERLYRAGEFPPEFAILTVRNPFAEVGAGQWYARAMSSYGLLQAITCTVRCRRATPILTTKNTW